MINNKGPKKETYPRGFAMRGWDPQNPTKRGLSFPVAKDEDTGEFVKILAGMVISAIQQDGVTRWTPGVPADADPSTLQIAFAQDSSTDLNVLAANSLVGLPFYDSYRLATPFFMRQALETSTDDDGAETTAPAAEAYVYAAGTRLTFAKNDETDWVSNYSKGVAKTSSRSAAGFVRPAAAGDTVIGIVPETYTGVNGAATAISADGTGDTNVFGAKPLQLANKPVDSTSLAENAYFVIFDSKQSL